MRDPVGRARRFLSAGLLAGLLAAAAAAPAADFARVYVSPGDGALRGYDLRTPSGWDGVTKVPAVLFLHGRGGSKFSFRLPSYNAELDTRGFVGIYWQGRGDPNALWSTYYIDAVNGISDEADVLACLDDALQHFAIDPDRIHLAGFSQGGKGALLIGLKNPDRFASIAVGAAPSDAFEGQIWSPDFPDYRDAAGGPYDGAAPAVLARWFAQSPRYFLPNARNIPIALFHGTLDSNVPDDGLRFPYRNTHHIADTPGFSDARGSVLTLLERHAADPAGYPFETHYPAVDHDEETCLQAGPLFAFFAGQTRVRNPGRVVAVSYDTKERSFYWARLGRVAPPDGTPASLDAATFPLSNRISIAMAGSPAVALDLAAAGLDTTRPVEVDAGGGSEVSLRVAGPFPYGVLVRRDGSLLRPDSDYRLENGAIVLTSFDAGSQTVLLIESRPSRLIPSHGPADGAPRRR
jgi:poly(3-hydroxybutyrate) depolymerase